MTINLKTWLNNDHLGISESQNVQDNSVNVTDNIHTQYFSGFTTFTEKVSHLGRKIGGILTNNSITVVPDGTIFTRAIVTFTELSCTFCDSEIPK